MTRYFSDSVTVQQDIEQLMDGPISWSKFANCTVLVTGATGMIPSYAVLALLQANKFFDLNLKIVALARQEKRLRERFGSLIEDDAVRCLVQDVLTPLPNGLGIDHIIHGASAARPSLHASDPSSTLNANILGTHSLLEYARREGVKSITLMSSAEIYGQVSSDIGLIREDDYGSIDLLSPRACYSEGKRAAETLCAVYHHQFGIGYTCARFGHVYGPGLSLDDGRVQADFARDIVTGRDITLKSAGLAQRTYTYVADAVEGMFVAMLNGQPGAYNISDMNGVVSIRELAEVFVAARPDRGLRLRFESNEDRLATNAVQFQGLDSSKLSTLGWKPRTDLKTGVSRTLTFYETQ